MKKKKIVIHVPIVMFVNEGYTQSDIDDVLENVNDIISMSELESDPSLLISSADNIIECEDDE